MSQQFTSGVPLGGLGCGKIEFCGDGAFRSLTTHNNIDQPFSNKRCQNDYTPEGLAEAFLFATVREEGTRLLKYAEAGAFFETMPPEGLAYEGSYPQAVLRAEPFASVGVEVQAFSPLIPELEHPRDSALPVAIFRMRVENRRREAVDVALGFSWPNVIGCGGYPGAVLADMRENKTVFVDSEEHGYLHFKHTCRKVDKRLEGEYALLAPKSDAHDLSWVTGVWGEDLWSYLGREVRLPDLEGSYGLGAAGSIAPGNTGALCASFKLEAGESREIPMILSWFFPEKTANQKDVVYRNAYARDFDSACEVAEYTLSKLEYLAEGTARWQKRLSDSDLEPWLQEKLINNLFPMSSCSMYLDDGRFSINEAPTDMGGCMGTIDQRSAAATAYLQLFPEIAKSELQQFIDQQIGEQHPKRFGKHWDAATGTYGKEIDRLGAIKHELGWDELEEGKYGGELWCNLHWPDLTCVFVLQCYQQISWTGDRDFLKEAWPAIKLALDFHKRLDQDGDGLADLWGPGSSTFDNEQFPYYGAVTFVATLYLAALQAAIKLAEHLGEEDYQLELKADFAQARLSVESQLWDESRGTYYCWRDSQSENWKDSARAHDEVSENSMLAHLAGVWFADRLGLGEILDSERVQRSLGFLYKTNVEPIRYCAPNEMQPDGTKSYSWPFYGETYFAANAIRHDRVDEGMEMVHKFYEASFVKNSSPWDIPLGWDGEGNGTPTWGRWYMTNPSSWNVLEALVGLRYDALSRELTLDPRGKQYNRLPVFHPLFCGSLTVEEDRLTLMLDEVRVEEGLSIQSVRTAAGPVSCALLNEDSIDLRGDGSMLLHAGDCLLVERGELSGSGLLAAATNSA